MSRKRIFKILVPLATFALFMVCAIPIAIAETLAEKAASCQYVQKTDVVEVIIDETESMNELYKGSPKLKQQKALINLFNETIPSSLKLTAAARAFGQFKIFEDATSKILFAPTNYNKSLLPQSIASFDRGRGFSPLDAALDGATEDLKSQSGQMAVVVFSNGLDMQKYQPVAAAQRLKKAYGDRVAIYTVVLGDKYVTVDIGDKAEGLNVMKQVADAGGSGFMTTGDSISTKAGMEDFVEKVFYCKDSDCDGVCDNLDKCPDTPKGTKVDAVGCPIPEPVPEPAAVEPKLEAPVSMTLHVQFASDKADIQTKYMPEIEKVAEFMKQYPGAKAVIEGHTDSTHTQAYNQKLSEKRANSVKNALVKEYNVDASRLEAVGYGEDKPIASNKTKAGKAKNRRVTANFSNKE